MKNIVFRIISGIIAGIFFFVLSGIIHNAIFENDLVAAMNQPIIIWVFGLFGCGVGYKYSTKVYEVILHGFGSVF